MLRRSILALCASMLLAASVPAQVAPATPVTPVTPTAPEPTSAQTEAARAHYARGLRLYEQRAYAAALAEFQDAHRLVPNPKLLFSMGQAHAGMGQYARAIEELGAYVERVSDTMPAGRRDQIERQLEAFRQRVGHLEVTVNVPGATIRVDDDRVGESPLRGPILLDVGPHRVTATRLEYLSASAHVSVVGAETTPVVLALQGSPAAEQTDLSTPLWIATGVCGALALGSGISTLIQRQNYDRSLEQGHAGPAEDTQHDLQQQRSRLEKWLLITDILIGATAATGIAAVYVSVRESDAPENATSHNVDVYASVSGRF